jgi:proline iminopeptidase
LLVESQTRTNFHHSVGFTEPITTHDGLAVYSIGVGPSLLLLPSPHGMTLHSTAESPLTYLMAGIGRRVITFDPPGAYRSSRPARFDMAEMLECAQLALEICRVDGLVDVLGHGEGGLCALAIAIDIPSRVNRLALINTASGEASIQRNRGIPWHWHPTSRNFWKWIGLSLQVRNGRGNLAAHKRLERLIRQASFYNKNLAPEIPIYQGDFQRHAPLRNHWSRETRKLDLNNHLGRVWSPTLVCAGRYDPQTPLGCSQELTARIPYARQVVFEQSGHYPYIEEPKRFARELNDFFSETTPVF